MRDYGKVYSTFWSSSTTSSLSDNGKLLALYLMTCSHSTIAGVFRLPDGYVSEDLNWGLETVAEGFAELFAKGFANRCETTKWVWIRKHLEWNKPENPNQRKSAAKIALSVPDACSWKPAFMRDCSEVLAIEWGESANPSETVAEPFLNQKQEQKQEQKNPTGSAAPVKPSRKPVGSKRVPGDFAVTPDMEAWATENATLIDWRRETEKFRDWEFKTPRTDWAATWRTWMRKAQDGAIERGQTPGASTALFAGAI